MRPSVTLMGHALVLSLGFILVVPLATGRSAAPALSLAVQYPGQLLGTASVHSHGAPDMREVIKASTLEERVRLHPDDEVQVPLRAARVAGVAQARQPQSVAGVHPGRQVDGVVPADDHGQDRGAGAEAAGL